MNIIYFLDIINDPNEREYLWWKRPASEESSQYSRVKSSRIPAVNERMMMMMKIVQQTDHIDIILSQ